jgi:hypothetical protein
MHLKSYLLAWPAALAVLAVSPAAPAADLNLRWATPAFTVDLGDTFSNVLAYNYSGGEAVEGFLDYSLELDGDEILILTDVTDAFPAGITGERSTPASFPQLPGPFNPIAFSYRWNPVTGTSLGESTFTFLVDTKAVPGTYTVSLSGLDFSTTGPVFSEIAGGDEFLVTIVPEPGAPLLLAAGAALAWGLRRRPARA